MLPPSPIRGSVNLHDTSHSPATYSGQCHIEVAGEHHKLRKLTLWRALETVLACPAALLGLSSRQSSRDGLISRRSLTELEAEIRQQFTASLATTDLLFLSTRMQRQYREKLQSSPHCMLPSYNHTLPSGNEMGTYLALDVGGSTFRVALVSLAGRAQGQEALKIVRMTSTAIDERVRSLEGQKFFDWMASRIKSTLMEGPGVDGPEHTLPIGLSWSFPIEQTSIRGGKVQNMGKGFNCSKGTLGQDLGQLIEAACSRVGLNVRIDAIVNDSSAALLSKAYLDPFASMSLILGTGMNSAVHMPVSQIGREKLLRRRPSWHARAERVITNTELSMFGGSGILPRSRFDDLLNQSHPLPDFQPLEYMTTGRYLGEIFRLICLEAIETAGLFQGALPNSITIPYTLDTAFLAILESDTTPNMSRATAYLEKTLAFTTLPSLEDLSFLRAVAECVSTRAAAYLAVSIHALWAIGRDSEDQKGLPTGIDKTTIACDGSVINKYPGFRDMCESYIASMISKDERTSSILPEIHLEPANEAPILGAAVAVAVCEAEPPSSSSSSSSPSSSPL